jgi:hypothetical protein
MAPLNSTYGRVDESNMCNHLHLQTLLYNIRIDGAIVG